MKKISCIIFSFCLLFALAPISQASENSYVVNGVTVTASSGTAVRNCSTYASQILKKIWTVKKGTVMTTYSNSYNLLNGKTADDRALTEEHVKAYIQAAPLGSRIRVCESSSTTANNYDNNARGHTMVLVAKNNDAETFTVLEAGWGAAKDTTYSYKSFADYYKNSKNYPYFFYIADYSAAATNNTGNIGQDNHSGSNVPSLTISGQTLPTTLDSGSNFGIRGIVKTDVGSITKVHGEILNDSGAVVQSGDAFPNQATHDLRYSINNNLIFDDLPVGNYTYRVIATAANGTETVTTTLIDSPFTVGSLWTENQMPTLHIEGQNAPTSLSIGQNFGIRGTVRTSCGSITRVVGEIINSQGEVVQTGDYSPYTSSHDLRYSINNDLIFNNLPAGSYIYKVTATAVNDSKSETAILIESPFTVN